MSFETWWVTYKLDDDKLFADWGKDAWDAGRAESEAQIAALKVERDALMEAVEIYERLLATPASGEPARKP